MSETYTLEINIDGACKGNPGISGAGISIRKANYDRNGFVKDREFVLDISKNLGIKTCNQAEYLALIIALEYCIEEEYYDSSIEIISDSKLVVNQMLGKFKVNNANIIPFHIYAKQLYSKFTNIKIRHTNREKNVIADRLANEGVLSYNVYTREI